ncbi:MAG: cysteine synthase family protein [Roseibium sp.]|uniref:PLP-dependent cysteine synthase family protein n=1 Tax=Roseibium sp. TaxID=1936156 RepID=UPI0026080915|nr:cysteine synthase family protein [Roseibium sp.]MCV0424184.1 cysteine synthase family protein [Roseibium sp.]
MIAENVLELIGNTPMMTLDRTFPGCAGRIVAKLECLNPTSIKDRPMLNLVRKAVASGKITSSTVVVEATSGNSGIALASIGTVLGFRVRLFMSEACSVERQKLMRAYGAELVLTPASEHTRGARDRAIAFCDADPKNTFFVNQHSVGENGEAHYLSTGPEIWRATDGKVGAVVIGLGTCGTLDGLSRYFKEKDPAVRIIGVEPKASPVFSGGASAPHRINGIGPGLVTENFKRVSDLVDDILLIDDDTAFEWARIVSRAEGLIVGPTSGATVWGADQVRKSLDLADRKIVCFLYDSGERYLSMDGLF